MIDAEDAQLLAAIVESSSDAIVSKSLDGTISSWNRAAERLFGYPAAEIIGRSILTLIPEERHCEEARIIEQLQRGERIEQFETVRRHRSGRLIDVSLTISPIRRANGTIVGASKIARDIGEARRAARLLERQAEWLATLNRVSSVICQDLDLERIVQSLTDEATAVTGAQFGAFFYNVLDAHGESYMLFSLSGAPREAFETFGMPRNTKVFAPTFAGEGVVRVDDIRLDPRYGLSAPHHGMPAGHLPVVSYLAVPVKSPSGVVIGGLFFGHDQPGVFGADTETLIVAIAAQAAVAIDNARLHVAASTELAQRRAAEEAKDLLLHEIKHRVKNTLAMVQALASQSLRHIPEAETRAFSERLRALAGAHDLLTQSEWSAIAFRSLLDTVMTPFLDGRDGRLVLQGDDIALPPSQALTLSMVIHELATNAVKYGALSTDEGTVRIDWVRQDGNRLALTWRESGGPPVTPPQSRGFGTRMIRSALGGVQGSSAVEFARSGVVVELAFDLVSADTH